MDESEHSEPFAKEDAIEEEEEQETLPAFADEGKSKEEIEKLACQAAVASTLAACEANAAAKEQEWRDKAATAKGMYDKASTSKVGLPVKRSVAKASGLKPKDEPAEERPLVGVGGETVEELL